MRLLVLLFCLLTNPGWAQPPAIGSIEPVREWFESRAGAPRLLLFFSPT